DVAVDDTQLAVIGRLDARLLGAALHRTADMEGAHGELGAGLADRLRRDDADRLADIDARAACQIATIAAGAHADPTLAGEGRADEDRIDAGRVDLLDRVLGDDLAALHHQRLGAGMDDVADRGAAEDALRQRRD